MVIDLDKIPQPLRGKLIKLGEQFGSQDTLDQANQTLGTYAKHAKALEFKLDKLYRSKGGAPPDEDEGAVEETDEDAEEGAGRS